MARLSTAEHRRLYTVKYSVSPRRDVRRRRLELAPPHEHVGKVGLLHRYCRRRMDRDALCDKYPRLYHVAWAGAIEGIKADGLLSTSALLDLYEVPPAEQMKIRGHHRDQPIPLVHPNRAPGLIRDHRPMSDTKLAGLLTDGLTTADWYRYLDRYVFFWVDRERARKMLGAYTKLPHLVLVVRTRQLLQDWHEKIRLTAFNTGDTHANKRRGYGDFQSVFAFKSSEVVEVCVMGGVPDIAKYIERVAEPEAFV